MSLEQLGQFVHVDNRVFRAVKAATSEIPVVFLHVDDPVAMGLVQSFARPGGSMTGFAGQPELPDKILQLYKDIVPGLRRPLILIDPDDPVARRGRWLAGPSGGCGRPAGAAARRITSTTENVQHVANDRARLAGVNPSRSRCRTDFDALRASGAAIKDLVHPGVNCGDECASAVSHN